MPVKNKEKAKKDDSKLDGFSPESQALVGKYAKMYFSANFVSPL
jgi:hypothetical protein